MKKTIIYISIILLSMIVPFNLAEAQVATSSAIPTPTVTVANQQNILPAKLTASPTPVTSTTVIPTAAPLKQVVTPTPVIQPTITPNPVSINNVQPSTQPPQTQSAPVHLQAPVGSVQAASLSTNKVPEPVSINNYPNANSLASPTPENTVPQSVGAAVLQNIHDTTSSFIKSPSTFFIPSNSENYYPSEGLSTKNTIILLLTGLLFIGFGNYLIKHSRQEAFQQKVKERIFYDWA